MRDRKNIRLREFRPADLAPVQEFLFKTIDVSYTKVYSPSAIQHFKDHHTTEEILHDAKEGYLVVLESDDGIIGTGTLLGNKVTRVYVKPEDRRCGFGKRIMNVLEQHARHNGLRTVLLYSSVVAKPFYESLGYRIEAQKSVQMEDGEHLEYFHMVKCLKENPGDSSSD